MNCDLIAPHYWWIERLGMGRALERRRRWFLPEIGNAPRALVLGDGDGRFLRELLRRNSAVRADYVDLSGRGCRGLQVHSSPLNGGGSSDSTGHDQFDLKIHHNVIHDTQCDGIILATVDPSQGAVEVYENVIYNAGTGPNNPEGSGAWSCVNVQGWTNTGTPGSGTIEVYNNTMYACGTFANPPYIGGNAGVFMSGPNANKKLRLRNNVISLTRNIPFIDAEDGNGGNCSSCSRVSGSNNLLFGPGALPASSYITGTLTSDPLFIDPAANNFQLKAGSPAADGGTPVNVAIDIAGRKMPQGAGYPIGAFEYVTGTTTTPAVSVSLTPASASLNSGQTQAFAATVNGSSNTTVTWSLNPATGSISSAGLYTAPALVNAATTVVVSARSVADSTKSASASITLNPVVVTVTGGGTIAPGGTRQLSYQLQGPRTRL